MSARSTVDVSRVFMQLSGHVSCLHTAQWTCLVSARSSVDVSHVLRQLSGRVVVHGRVGPLLTCVFAACTLCTPPALPEWSNGAVDGTM